MCADTEQGEQCVLVNDSWMVPILEVELNTNPWAQLCNIANALLVECPKIQIKPDELQCVGFSTHKDEDCVYYVYTSKVAYASLFRSTSDDSIAKSPPPSPPPLKPPHFTIQTQSNIHTVPILEYHKSLELWAQKSSSARPFKHLLSALDIIQSRTNTLSSSCKQHPKAQQCTSINKSKMVLTDHMHQYHRLMVTMQTQHIVMQQNMLKQYKMVSNYSE